ncbi:MAG: tetratricopeptide repeat protein [Chloroflexi bacterium]|nr:tetratricopeptide repeat protein [Chloroflexota bacterium]
MNAKLTTDNATYKLNETYRNDQMRAAEHHRLVKSASAAEDEPARKARYAHLVTLLRDLFRNGGHNGQPRHNRTLRRILHTGVIGLLLLLALLVFATPSFAQDVDAVDLHDSGETEAYSPALVDYRVGYYHQLQNDHVRAIEEFTSAIAVIPAFPQAFAARGDSYTALGDYASAIADYTVAVGYWPDYVSVLYMRGRAYMAVGETNLAMGDFQNAIDQMPEYALPFLGAGDLAYAQGNVSAALSYYQDYMIRTTDTPDALVVARITELESLV